MCAVVPRECRLVHVGSWIVRTPRLLALRKTVWGGDRLGVANIELATTNIVLAPVK